MKFDADRMIVFGDCAACHNAAPHPRRIWGFGDSPTRVFDYGLKTAIISDWRRFKLLASLLHR